jgi:hypothetical protein
LTAILITDVVGYSRLMGESDGASFKPLADNHTAGFPPG